MESPAHGLLSELGMCGTSPCRPLWLDSRCMLMNAASGKLFDCFAGIEGNGRCICRLGLYGSNSLRCDPSCHMRSTLFAFFEVLVLCYGFHVVAGVVLLAEEEGTVVVGLVVVGLVVDVAVQIFLPTVVGDYCSRTLIFHFLHLLIF